MSLEELELKIDNYNKSKIKSFMTTTEISSKNLKKGQKFKYVGSERILTVNKIDEKRFYYNGGLTEESGSREFPVRVELIKE